MVSAGFEKAGITKEAVFQRVYQSLDVTAKIKCRAEDFVVTEHIDIDFSGDGEHCWLYLQKRGCNTDWVAQLLARFCKVKSVAVSYAGLKDRHAVTRQWFSVQLPGRPTPDWDEFKEYFARFSKRDQDHEDGGGEGEEIEILNSFRHNRKLQRGALKKNGFVITLRDISDDSDEMFDKLCQRCGEIAANGVANYFGEQRFGRNRSNLDHALELFSAVADKHGGKKFPRRKVSRNKRSLYLSAARSWIFNHVLSERVARGLWNKRLPGDVYMLAGRSACFQDAAEEAGLIDIRLADEAIHPTAILWGEGDHMVTDQAESFEQDVADRFPVLRDGLEAARLQSQRRACRVIPDNMQCHRQGASFVVSFELPAGSYATVVLGEIFSRLA